jgi:predicted flap endonuclease-1-like 5' DNA nuclease
MASLADARLGELEEELQTLRDRELVQLTKRVGEVETQLQRTRADRDALRQSLSDHRKQREQLEATLAGIETRFADLEWRISRVSQADSEGSKELASRVAELERGLEQRDARLADLEARLAHAESRSAGPGRSSPSERASPEGTSDDPSSAHSDDLRRIRGIGPRFARALQDHGVHTFAQIAAWTEEDIDTMAERLGIRPQRIRRDGWVQSARKLAEPE